MDEPTTTVFATGGGKQYRYWIRDFLALLGCSDRAMVSLYGHGASRWFADVGECIHYLCLYSGVDIKGLLGEEMVRELIKRGVVEPSEEDR